MQAVRRE